MSRRVVKAAWNDYSDARSAARAIAERPDPGLVGYSGPPVLALMGYRGPYPVEAPLPWSKPEMVASRKRGRPSREVQAARDEKLAREIAQDFNSFGWVR